MIRNARVSVSYNEFNELSLGGTYPINDTTRAYAAGLTHLDSDYYRSSVGVLGSLRAVDYRLGLNCDSYDFHEVEAKLAYDFSSRFTGVGYVGLQSYGASTEMYYNLSGYYHLTNKVDLFAGIGGGNGDSDFTIGTKFAFGLGQERKRNDNLIILLCPTISTVRD